MHEVLGDEIRLDQRNTEGGDEEHYANMRHGADDAHDEQHHQDGPDLDVVGMLNVSFSRHDSSPGDVQQWEQENPNDVDEVPVQPDTFHALQFLIFCRV